MYPLEGTGPLGPILPDHPSEFVVGIVLFFIIFFVIWKVIMPRFEKLYDERTDTIRGGIERAESAQHEAEVALSQYRARLANAEEEAAQIRDEAKKAGVAIQADMRAQAQDEASRIVSAARVQIDAERSEALESLRKDVGSMATTLAGRILGEALDEDTRVRRTVDSFITSLSKDAPQK
ncbi:MAG: F0F1 ATP synthase subunit B [Propionibacteriaceae bacterium]|nr:F0F1 ATP synthase subunit B [Propionibacteriaceae bacterium]